MKTSHVIEDLIRLLQQRTDSANQKKKPGSKEFLIENLAKIEKALADYEIDIAEKALNSLNNMQWSKAISAAISEIVQKMLAFD